MFLFRATSARARARARIDRIAVFSNSRSSRRGKERANRQNRLRKSIVYNVYRGVSLLPRNKAPDSAINRILLTYRARNDEQRRKFHASNRQRFLTSDDAMIYLSSAVFYIRAQTKSIPVQTGRFLSHTNAYSTVTPANSDSVQQTCFGETSGDYSFLRYASLSLFRL